MKAKVVSLAQLILILLLVFGLSITAYAASLGTLSCWYATYTESETTSIGRWVASTLTVRTIKLNSDASFRFLIGVDHAASEWEDALASPSIRHLQRPLEILNITVGLDLK